MKCWERYAAMNAASQNGRGQVVRVAPVPNAFGRPVALSNIGSGLRAASVYATRAYTTSGMKRRLDPRMSRAESCIQSLKTAAAAEMDEEWRPHDRTTPMFSWEGRSFRARLVDAHDADTVRVVFRTDDESYKQFILRLAGIDAPEMNSKNVQEASAAVRARDRLLQLLAPGVFESAGPYSKKDVLRLLHDNIVLIDIDTKQYDKYGRLLAVVRPSGGRISVADTLMAEGHAKRYDGGHKERWGL